MAPDALGPGRPGLLSICIVNWETRDLLAACLRSLREHPFSGPSETIVVDNGSQDGSADLVRTQFPEVTLIANPSNLGYAAGTNQALRAAQGEWLLLLNSDTEVQGASLDALVACLRRHPEAGGASAHLLNPDGTVQPSVRAFPAPWPMLCEAAGLARLFPGVRLFSSYRMRWWGHDTEIAIDQPTSSALLLRREALQHVGLLDEEFLSAGFGTDIDLCLRLHRAGRRLVYCPSAPIIHHLGASTIKLGAARLAQSHAGLVRINRKHYPGMRHLPRRALVRAISRLSLWPRLRRLRRQARKEQP